MKKEIVNNSYLKLHVDESKNRIHASFHGFWASMDTMDSYLNSMGIAISSVSKGFTMVADLRDFKTLPPELVKEQKASMQKLGEAGLYKVAEILPASAIAKMQLSDSTKETNMPNKQFSTIVDGEEWLDAEVNKL